MPTVPVSSDLLASFSDARQSADHQLRCTLPADRPGSVPAPCTRWRWPVGCLAVLLCLSVVADSVAVAQPPRDVVVIADVPLEPLPLDIRILMEPSPRYALMAQDWTRVFQDVGYSVVFSSGRPAQPPGIEDVVVSNRRSVRVVGTMDRSGTLHFGGQQFRQTQTAQLRDFLDVLSRYGAAGPPQESPTWGMNDEQFKTVVKLLSTPVSQPVRLQTAVDAIESLPLPAVFRIQYTEAASRVAFREPEAVFPDPLPLEGISTGTAAAIALSQFGLGFRPMADANGGYVMEIDVGNETDNLWPTGWKSTEPLNLRIPTIYKSIAVGDLQDADVDGVIQLLANRLEVPWFSSGHALRQAGLNLGTLTFSRKPDSLSPSSLLRKVADKLRLGIGFRVDEASRPFIWVTTVEQDKAFDARFAHVRPRP